MSNHMNTRNTEDSQLLVVLPLLAAAILALMLLFPALAHAEQPDDVLAGVDKFSQGAKDSSEVTLDKNMLGLASGMFGNGGNADAKGLTKNMDLVIVRSYTYATPGQYKMEDVEQIRKRLDTGGWSHLVKEHNEKGSTDICVKTDVEGGISEMVIIDAEPKELSFIHLKGHMSAKDLSKMSGSFGGPADPMLKQRDK
jgi:hypothetical protein